MRAHTRAHTRAHMMETYEGRHASKNQDDSEMGSHCKLNENQKLNTRLLFDSLVILREIMQPGESEEVRLQHRLLLRTCAKSLHSLPYTSNLISLHFPVLIHYLSLPSWSPTIRLDWFTRIRTLLAVLCNNFTYQNSTLEEQCVSAGFNTAVLNKKRSTEDDARDDIISDLLNCSAGQMAYFIHQHDSLGNIDDIIHTLEESVSALLSPDLVHMMRTYGSHAMQWKGLQLVQHALFLADRNSNDVFVHGQRMQRWGESSSIARIEEKLSNSQEISDFLVKTIDQLKEREYSYDIPTSGNVTYVNNVMHAPVDW